MGDETTSEAKPTKRLKFPAPNAQLQTKLKNGLVICSKIASNTVIIVTEIAFVMAIGGYVGTYMSAKTIVEDCRRVSIAKVGDAYVRCAIVENVKDAADKPPR